MVFTLLGKKGKLLTASFEQKIGRWTELNNETEVSDLKKGMDFREPIYRREVFLRFYDFHLKHRSHPGGVYFAMPWLANKFNHAMEDKLWLAFINGCSQNIVTTHMIMEKFPTLNGLDINDLDNWWNEVLHKYKSGSGWDSDRKYFKAGKTGFPNCVASYKNKVDEFGSQVNLFDSLNDSGDIYKNFEKTWDYVRDNFLSFGRLSTFSYLEYLRIQGIPLDCNNLFLEDKKGSQSHRNGLCKVLGRDDLDWWDTKKSTNPNFPGYKPDTIEWLKVEADTLLEEAKVKIKHKDVSYFTLESTFCCYKSWYRPNRRYPNVYMDMMHDRIKYAEQEWGNNFEIFWEMRRDNLPKSLRLEDNPNDVGLKPEKQNHFRETGEVILMNEDYPCFENNYIGQGSLYDFI